ncbi:NDxxF motif lipoprotein [Mammaliicoccus sciuri]|uniref:NDxxF motif lipoprotein n=1 Tax=Mammaliicoccus sciuri TaxID=1296 RepID=UPI00191460C9|nr:NDxxF motif lipoprotein [Mammaliicoccus sciuri]MCD8885013.1 NDxxF motif lipoprotein [Mammaliicoccus sciuri]MDU0267161.1 NDxxF motif lipoprotein [Mammaliicoccus sciuri]QQQ10568.1 NDxxF motif lipoprotein [Mammaliicoccus sciuri]WQL92935.1 NDxxF motif lipoprotein [Mammaliicoccus sciuri]
MKKFKSVIIYSSLALLLVGCGNEESSASKDNEHNQSEQKTNKHENAKLPTVVFESDLTNEKLSKSEIHKSILRYLDTNESIYKVTTKIEEKVWDEQPLTKREADQLEEGRKLLEKNDQNFSNYIENNTLPNGYQKETNRISQYFTSYNQTIKNLDQQVQKIEDKAEKGTISTKDIKDIVPDSQNVNGRQQEKIEKFLKQINVKTNAFKR